MSSATPLNRETFVAVLREGLHGLPHDVIADLVRDYEAHFEEGERRGRSLSDIVAGLGDPQRLARELRAEVRIKKWEVTRSPSAAIGAVLGLAGLGALDLLALIPLFIVVAAILLAFLATAIGVLSSGALLLASPLLSSILTGPAGERFVALVAQSGEGAIALMGLSLLSGSVAAGAALLLLGAGMVRAAAWYGRLHYRLLRPQLNTVPNPQPTKITVIGT